LHLLQVLVDQAGVDRGYCCRLDSLFRTIFAVIVVITICACQDDC
jgi:hypothetical protein